MGLFQNKRYWINRHPYLSIFILCLSIFFIFKIAHSNSNVTVKKHQPQIQQVEVTPKTNLAESFPMEAYGNLVKECFNSGAKNPLEVLQTKLNAENGINNIDINKDGYIDPLIVVESPNSTKECKTINLIALPNNKDKNGYDSTFICSTDFKVTADPVTGKQSYDVGINANPDYYQQNYCCYNSHFDAGDLLLAMWLFSPHSYYYGHPYYYGHSYYGRPIVTRNVYISRTTVYRTNNRFTSRPYNSNSLSRNSYYNKYNSKSSTINNSTPTKTFTTETKNKSSFNSNTNSVNKNSVSTNSNRTLNTSTPSKSFNIETKNKSNFNSTPSRSSSSSFGSNRSSSSGSSSSFGSSRSSSNSSSRRR